MFRMFFLGYSVVIEWQQNDFCLLEYYLIIK